MYKLPENLDSKYRFVTLASKRAEQLQSGARARVDEMDHRKATVVAQAEVAEELVTLWTPQDDSALDLSDDEEEE